MVERKITNSEAGRSLQKYLGKLFPKMPKSFLFKALRSGKIKLNGKKVSEPGLSLQAEDELRLYLTEEQLKDFGYLTSQGSEMEKSSLKADLSKLEILYEDAEFLIVNKPAGLLTQRSQKTDISLTELALSYLQPSPSSYRPSFCHRLDRNTCGVLVMAKTLEAHHLFDRLMKEGSIRKIYRAVVEGDASVYQTETLLVHGYEKNERLNKAEVFKLSGELQESRHKTRVKTARLKARCQESNGSISLLEIELLTGFSHQIRAQLSFEGFPIVGDGKYNPHTKKYSPMLAAKALGFPAIGEGCGHGLSGRRIEAPLPSVFESLDQSISRS